MFKGSRKEKKRIIGTKVNRRTLCFLLKNVRIIKPTGKSMYSDDHAEYSPFAFCPKCGCTHMTAYNHDVGYPECWIEFFCSRCGELVAEIDNSPLHHVLEWYIEDRDERGV